MLERSRSTRKLLLRPIETGAWPGSGRDDIRIGGSQNVSPLSANRSGRLQNPCIGNLECRALLRDADRRSHGSNGAVAESAEHAAGVRRLGHAIIAVDVAARSGECYLPRPFDGQSRPRRLVGGRSVNGRSHHVKGSSS